MVFFLTKNVLLQLNFPCKKLTNDIQKKEKKKEYMTEHRVSSIMRQHRTQKPPEILSNHKYF